MAIRAPDGANNSISIMIELGVQGQQSKRTDIEVLCEIIYAHGERYICEIHCIVSIIEKEIFVKFLWLDLCFQRLIICVADMTTARLPLGSPGCSRYRVNIERQLKVNSAHLKN